MGIPESLVVTRLTEAQDDFATHLESDSDYSLALIDAARHEEAPADAVVRALRAAGVDAAAALAAAEGPLASAAPHSARAATNARSPFTLAAKWLVLGWLVGLVASSLGYALSDAVASTSRHGAAAR